MSERKTGTVKWFSHKKGFGFISPDQKNEANKDYFVHYSELQQNGYKTLDDGQRVSFVSEKSDKGYTARDVSVIDSD